jgi:competence protein ComGF
MPGVYFNYHIGGMVVDFYHSRFTLLQFLISLCAIIGGAYTICMILYNFTNKIFVNNEGYELIH